MKTNKILLGGVAGGVTFFLLGWLVYGILLSSYMTANLNQCAARPMTEMVWWAMILSNLALGFLLALVFTWSKIDNLKSGARVSAILGVLISASVDLGNYSMTNVYSSLSVIVVDVLVYTILLTITGIVVAKVIGTK
jgi:hypothetical protein